MDGFLGREMDDERARRTRYPSYLSQNCPPRNGGTPRGKNSTANALME
jgi:hypothetical protein